MLDFLEIIKEKGAGDLLFDADIEAWASILLKAPEIDEDDEAFDYNWYTQGVYLSLYNDGRKCLRIGKEQINLSYQGINFFKDDNAEVHRKMCELDGEPMHKLGYTYLCLLYTSDAADD